MRLVPPARSFPPFVASENQRAALWMLELFASIGATRFDVTHTHLSGEKRGFRRDRDLNEVATSLPYLVTAAERRQNNLIIRPRLPKEFGAVCIQLDDIDAAKASKITPAAFLVIETSPASFQAWVAVKDAPLGTTARLRRGIGADLNASGATRIAGSFNFKPKYAPHFPTVRVAADQLGHIATVAELDALHVLAQKPQRVEIVRPATERRPAGKWPSYQRCLDGAPIGDKGNPSRTAADFVWCKIAASWRHPVDAVARELMRVSSKAQENGEGYAKQTAERAAWAAAQRPQPKP